MKKLRFSEQQIAYVLQREERGTLVDEICGKMGLAQSTLFAWKKRFVGLGPEELCRLKQLEEENAKVQKLMTDLSLAKAMLQDVFHRNA